MPAGTYERTSEMRAEQSARAIAHGLGHVNHPVKHGLKHTRAYVSWHMLKQRCLNPRNSRYARYGGRGITVCDRWIDSFENFYADMGERPEGMSIDRIDNDGNYEPGNVRWAGPTTQLANRRYSKGS